MPTSAQVGTQVGQAPSQCNLGGDGTSATGGTGVTISVSDATHVTGSFDIVLGPNFGNAHLNGTFDVPLCPPDPSLKTGGVSGYSNCCMQSWWRGRRRVDGRAGFP